VANPREKSLALHPKKKIKKNKIHDKRKNYMKIMHPVSQLEKEKIT